MMLRPLSALVLAGALAAPASAQLVANVTVGPNPAPPVCEISFTVSHDAIGFISVQTNEWRVYGPGDTVVYDPGGGGSIAAVGPYGWSTRSWDQRDQNGNLVPPGVYTIQIRYDFQDPTYHEVVIDPAATTGIVFEGTATIGDPLGGGDRNFYLCAPGEGGYSYYLLASFSSTTGLPTCGGTLPLDVDLLLSKSSIPNKIFKPSFGELAPNGTTRSPRFPIPNDLTLVGIELFTAFMTLDLADPVCVVREISPALKLTII